MKLPSDIKESQPPKKNLPYTLAKIAGLLLGIGLVYWFVSQSNLAGIWDQLKRINLNFFFLIAVTFASYVMTATAWRLSFYTYPGHISLPLLFMIHRIGESFAQINPTNVIAGETLKGLILKKRGIPIKDSIISFTISRFLVLFSAVTLVMIGIYALSSQLDSRANAAILIVIISIMFFLLVMLIYRLAKGKGILSGPKKGLALLLRKFPHSQRLTNAMNKINEMDDELHDFYRKKKANLLVAFLLCFLSWFCGAMEFFVVLYFLGFNPTFWSCVAIEVGIMVFKFVGAFIPGQIGIEEYGSKVMLDFINVPDANIWITVAILRRARQLFWIGVGFIAFLIIIRTSKELKDGDTVYNP